MKIKLDGQATCGFLILFVVVILLLQDSYREPFSNIDNAPMHNSLWVNDVNQYHNSMTNKKRHDYKGTSVPLSENEMFYFANNEFKGECCPSTYSSSTGCACMSVDQINYLNQRGGNRTITSNY